MRMWRSRIWPDVRSDALDVMQHTGRGHHPDPGLGSAGQRAGTGIPRVSSTDGISFQPLAQVPDTSLCLTGLRRTQRVLFHGNFHQSVRPGKRTDGTAGLPDRPHRRPEQQPALRSCGSPARQPHPGGGRAAALLPVPPVPGPRRPRRGRRFRRRRPGADAGRPQPILITDYTPGPSAPRRCGAPGLRGDRGCFPKMSCCWMRRPNRGGSPDWITETVFRVLKKKGGVVGSQRGDRFVRHLRPRRPGPGAGTCPRRQHGGDRFRSGERAARPGAG